MATEFEESGQHSMSHSPEPPSPVALPNGTPAGLPPPAAHVVGSDVPFKAIMFIIASTYVIMLAGMLIADFAYLATSDGADRIPVPASLWMHRPLLQKYGLEWAQPVARPFLTILAALSKEEIQYSVKLTLLSCFFTAILSLLVAVPIGYLLSRTDFRSKGLIDAILDIPIVLPPLIVGLSLLIMFKFLPFSLVRGFVVFKIPAVVLAQFMVSAAFAIRVMRSTFDQINPRVEQVALTLGCTQSQAFGMVVLPQAGPGMLTAGTLAWARAMGEFGPLLIFAGATRMKTEVLSTTVFLELSIGNLEAAVAVSLIMIFAAVMVMVVLRLWGTRRLFVSSH
jgi:molybdate transport system permease protein